MNVSRLKISAFCNQRINGWKNKERKKNVWLKSCTKRKNLLESDMLVYQNRSPYCDNCYKKTSYHASLSYHGYIDAEWSFPKNIKKTNKKNKRKQMWEMFFFLTNKFKIHPRQNAKQWKCDVYNRHLVRHETGSITCTEDFFLIF